MIKKITNLDTLRFIAAALVVIHHIELYKTFYDLPNVWDIAFFKIIGKLAVVLFFVLSGFLITTLLLTEKDKTGTINFKNFYVRRILRIWPVYYLIVFLGFFVYPYLPYFDIPNKDVFPNVLENIIPNIFYYITIFANLGLAIYKDVPYTSQTWSLATEEQFYLLWPMLIAFLPKKHYIKAILGVIIGYWLLKIGFEFKALVRINMIDKETNYFINKFLYFFNINCMATGSLFAVLIHYKHKISRYILNPKVFITSVLVLMTMLALGKEYGFFHYDVYALFFGIIICNLAFNPLYKNVLENKFTNFLGTISYGIYMYHFVALTIGLNTAKYYNCHWLVYPITFGLTILISIISYKYFETFFLKLKSKF